MVYANYFINGWITFASHHSKLILKTYSRNGNAPIDWNGLESGTERIKIYKVYSLHVNLSLPRKKINATLR